MEEESIASLDSSTAGKNFLRESAKRASKAPSLYSEDFDSNSRGKNDELQEDSEGGDYADDFEEGKSQEGEYSDEYTDQSPEDFIERNSASRILIQQESDNSKNSKETSIQKQLGKNSYTHETVSQATEYTPSEYSQEFSGSYNHSQTEKDSKLQKSKIDNVDANKHTPLQSARDDYSQDFDKSISTKEHDLTSKSSGKKSNATSENSHVSKDVENIAERTSSKSEESQLSSQDSRENRSAQHTEKSQSEVPPQAQIIPSTAISENLTPPNRDEIPLPNKVLRKTSTAELLFGKEDSDSEAEELKRKSYDSIKDSEKLDTLSKKSSLQQIAPAHLLGGDLISPEASFSTTHILEKAELIHGNKTESATVNQDHSSLKSENTTAEKGSALPEFSGTENKQKQESARFTTEIAIEEYAADFEEAHPASQISELQAQNKNTGVSPSNSRIASCFAAEVARVDATGVSVTSSLYVLSLDGEDPEYQPAQKFRKQVSIQEEADTDISEAFAEDMDTSQKRQKKKTASSFEEREPIPLVSSLSPKVRAVWDRLAPKGRPPPPDPMEAKIRADKKFLTDSNSKEAEGTLLHRLRHMAVKHRRAILKGWQDRIDHAWELHVMAMEKCRHQELSRRQGLQALWGLGLTKPAWGKYSRGVESKGTIHFQLKAAGHPLKNLQAGLELEPLLRDAAFEHAKFEKERNDSLLRYDARAKAAESTLIHAEFLSKAVTTMYPASHLMRDHNRLSKVTYCEDLLRGDLPPRELESRFHHQSELKGATAFLLCKIALAKELEIIRNYRTSPKLLTEDVSTEGGKSHSSNMQGRKQRPHSAPMHQRDPGSEFSLPRNNERRLVSVSSAQPSRFVAKLHQDVSRASINDLISGEDEELQRENSDKKRVRRKKKKKSPLCDICGCEHSRKQFYIPSLDGGRNTKYQGNFCSWDCVKMWNKENSPIQQRYELSVIIDIISEGATIH